MESALKFVRLVGLIAVASCGSAAPSPTVIRAAPESERLYTFNPQDCPFVELDVDVDPNGLDPVSVRWITDFVGTKREARIHFEPEVVVSDTVVISQSFRPSDFSSTSSEATSLRITAAVAGPDGFELRPFEVMSLEEPPSFEALVAPFTEIRPDARSQYVSWFFVAESDSPCLAAPD